MDTKLKSNIYTYYPPKLYNKKPFAMQVKKFVQTPPPPKTVLKEFHEGMHESMECLVYCGKEFLEKVLKKFIKR